MFNLAMLGKQGWRLITKPNSLCARVLKGRYYHDGDFLSATRKKHASQTWCAIIAGREVLRKGLTKRIGDGLNTNIWRDNWLPNHPLGRPFTSSDNQAQDLVADLLTPSGHWNEEIIRSVFCDFDAEAILSTLVNGQGRISGAGHQRNMEITRCARLTACCMNDLGKMNMRRACQMRILGKLYGS